MPTFSIQLFGKFCVRRDQQILEGFEARKMQELFCYLLLHRDHPIPRETLAGLLWPDTTTSLSKRSLRQTLWHLHTAISSFAELDNDRVLLVEADWVQFNAEAHIWLDAAIFEQAFELTQKIPVHGLDTTSAEILHNAVQLYQGPLLEGWYQDWCLLERERLQNMYLVMLDKLMWYCELQKEYETGILYGMRIMCYDRARERTHRRLMRLYCLNGDRTGALRQFEQCAAALEEELGVKPSKGTLALYEQIQADQLDEPDFVAATSEADISNETTDATNTPLLEILGQLTQLQAALSTLQEQVQQSIHKVERTLSHYL
ncbi:MAG TPA: BTAD domain-containing putative transcriptional regulator [Ktedonobacteraceae bacterium]|nr:BTAD domain-containing putative transcriptional regulator [Ktedonobacteraceae bacterium]